MSLRIRGLLAVFLTLLLSGALPAFAKDQWTAPTAQELKMTSVPQVQGAPAVCLDYDQTNDEDVHQVIVYVRIKVLTEAGLRYGDVELPYDKGDHYSIKKVEARTIHADGTVIPFTGKPYDKQVVRTHSFRYYVKVFTMPDVTVGSILEYRYVLHYGQDSFIPPRWYAQQDLFVLHEHFVFQPDKQFHYLVGGATTRSFEWTSALPRGVDVQNVKGQWQLTMSNVPPIDEEKWMPPRHNLESKVLFYYTDPSLPTTSDAYWQRTGAWYSMGVDAFMVPDKLKKVALSLVSSQDSDNVKVAKLYDAMMGLENTSFTRQETQKEEKATHSVIHSAADVWNAKRGSANQIAMLFIGLARAAGLKAYAMWVSDRSLEFFEKNYLTTDQLDDIIAIVVVNGKEEYFDPGARFCPLGKLAWYDAATTGIRQGPTGTTLANTPTADFRDAEILRRARLQLDAAGKLTGTIGVVMTGTAALIWRDRALQTDEIQMKKDFEREIKAGLPPGVEVNLIGFDGIKEWKTALVANLAVTGTLGTRSGKLLLLPASFFEATEKSALPPEERRYAIYMDYPYAEEDEVNLSLPSDMKIDAMPEDASLGLKAPNNTALLWGQFESSYRTSVSGIQFKRVLAIGVPLFPAQYYPQIRDFFGRVNAQDRQRVVLRTPGD